MPTFRQDTKIGGMVPMMKTDDINDQAITKDKIRDGNVTAEKLADGAVSTDKLPDGAIKTPKIADENITTSKLAEASVVTSKIADQNVTKEKIADQSVDNSKLSPEAVTYDKLKDKSVITEKLNDRAVTTEKIEEKAITNAKIGDSAVDGRVISEASVEKKHLANDSVATEKLQDSAITSDKIHIHAVTEEKIEDSAISNSKLADNSVGTSKIKDGNVTNEKVANNTITIDKFDPELRKSIQAATGLPENLVEVIQDVDVEVKSLHSKDEDLQSQIADKQQQITAHDKDIESLQNRSTQMELSINNIAVTGGASVANTVAYSNTASGLVSINAQGAIDELAAKNATKAEKAEVTAELEKKFDKESILQESGNSEDKVMSQKATTTAIADETTRAKAAEEAIIFDVSANNNDAVFESLQSLLSSDNLSTLIPTSVRCGGMTIRFIQSSDNKYVQYRLMTNAFSTTESDWQGVDDAPTPNSDNFVKSGGVDARINADMLEINGRISVITNRYIGTPVGSKVQLIYWEGRAQTFFIKRTTGDIDDNIFTVEGATPSIFVWMDENFIVTYRENASQRYRWRADSTYLSVGFNNSDNPNGYDNVKISFDNNLEVRFVNEFRTLRQRMINDGWKYNGFITPSSQPRSTSGQEAEWYLAVGPGTFTNFIDYSTNEPIVLPGYELYTIRRQVFGNVPQDRYMVQRVSVWSIDGVQNYIKKKINLYALSSNNPRINPNSLPDTPDASGMRRLYIPITCGTYTNFPDYKTGNPIVVGYNEFCIIREHWFGVNCDGYIKDTIYISDKASALYNGYRVQDNYRMNKVFSNDPNLEITDSSDTAVILPVIERSPKKIKLRLNSTYISFLARVVDFSDNTSILRGITELDCSLYKKVGLIIRLSGSDATVLTESQIKQLIVEPDDSDIDQAVSDWFDAHPEATTSIPDGSISIQKLDTSLADKANRLRLDDTHPASQDYETGDGFNTIVGYGNRGKGLGTGRGNCILGTGNLFFATTANRNVAIGHHSQYRQVTGQNNVSIGNEASDNINGDANTSVGADALRAQKYSVFPGQVEVTNPEQVQLEHCTAIGYRSQCFSVGIRNTTLGSECMQGEHIEGVGCTGDENTAVGFSTKLFHHSGNGNTALGSYAQEYNKTGSNNVAIGFRAGCYQQSGDRKLFIDALDRQNAADELTKSLIVGEFNSNPSSQKFIINAGLICMPYLPTSDPQVAGALWNDNGVLKISSSSKHS